jgi:[ribosomal protein S5]-alanine N-acetyltransferase
MPTISLSTPSPSDCADLLAFELANQTFFEEHINARPVDYYSLEGVRRAISDAAQDAKSGIAFQYLVRDAAGLLVARVNLSRVKRAHFHSAELGYRVAEASTGLGVAGTAVGQVLRLAFTEHRLHRIEANSRPENVGSIAVLERNGFRQFGRATRSFQLRGTWYDLLYFERHADA